MQLVPRFGHGLVELLVMAGLVKRRVTRPASNSKERASAAIPAVNKAPAMPAAAAQELKIGFLIHDVSRLRRTMFDQMMKPYGVTRAQWWVIAHLSRKDGMTQTQLAAMLDITKVTLGGIIDRLEVGGWVRREVRLSDRRTNFVFLTQQSLDLLRGMQSVEKMLNRRVLKGLTGVERDLIAELLGLLRVNLVDSLSAEGDIPAMIESLDLFRSINKQDRK